MERGIGTDQKMMSALPTLEEEDECFRPTDQKLVNHFLKLKLQGSSNRVCRIPEVDIYQYEPQELPYLSGMRLNSSEWYFFCRRHELKGGRFCRLTKDGYWKSTGQDRNIKNETKKVIGKKKSLIYYIGRTRKRVKTNWKMHEYRATLGLSNEEDFIICKLMHRPDTNGNVFTDDESERSNITPDYDNQSPDENTNCPNYNEGYGSGYGNMPTCRDGGKPSFQMHFDFQNQNSRQNIAYLANDQPAMGCHMTSAYNNNPADIMVAKEVIGRQQPTSLFGHNNQDYCQNSTRGPHMPTENSLSIQDYGFSASPSLPMQEFVRLRQQQQATDHQLQTAAKAMLHQILKMNLSYRMEPLASNSGPLLHGNLPSSNAMENGSSSSRISELRLSEVLPSSVLSSFPVDPGFPGVHPSNAISSEVQPNPSIVADQLEANHFAEVNAHDYGQEEFLPNFTEMPGKVSGSLSGIPTPIPLGPEIGNSNCVDPISSAHSMTRPAENDAFPPDEDVGFLVDEMPKRPSINDDFWELFLTASPCIVDTDELIPSTPGSSTMKKRQWQSWQENRWDKIQCMNDITEQMELKM